MQLMSAIDCASEARRKLDKRSIESHKDAPVLESERLERVTVACDLLTSEIATRPPDPWWCQLVRQLEWLRNTLGSQVLPHRHPTSPGGQALEAKKCIDEYLGLLSVEQRIELALQRILNPLP
jgi:hypothetical protein